MRLSRNFHFACSATGEYAPECPGSPPFSHPFQRRRPRRPRRSVKGGPYIYSATTRRSRASSRSIFAPPRTPLLNFPSGRSRTDNWQIDKAGFSNKDTRSRKDLWTTWSSPGQTYPSTGLKTKMKTGPPMTTSGGGTFPRWETGPAGPVRMGSAVPLWLGIMFIRHLKHYGYHLHHSHALCPASHRS
jgi:hypothetical protein